MTYSRFNKRRAERHLLPNVANNGKLFKLSTKHLNQKARCNRLMAQCCLPEWILATNYDCWQKLPIRIIRRRKHHRRLASKLSKKICDFWLPSLYDWDAENDCPF